MPRKKTPAQPRGLRHDGQQYLLDSPEGRTRVDEAVVAKLASMAAREVEGVHELIPVDVAQRLSSVALGATGRVHRSQGVQVSVGTVEAAVEVHLVARSDAPIPALAAAVRENVSRRVQHATGLHIKRVDVTVVNLAFPELVQAPPAEAATELQ